MTDTITGVEDAKEVSLSETLSFRVAGGVTSDGSVDKFTVPGTVEINDSTTNGPVLVDEDRFGKSIANIGDLDGDGFDDLAVGAPYDDNLGSNQGVIHIMFMNANGSVKSTEEIHGTTSNGPTLANGWWFGWSVENVGDIDGDGKNEIAGGAILDHSGGNQKGAVNIMFMNDDGSGSVDSTVEINDLTTNGPTLNNGDRFGYSIANIGDLDGDGFGDLAVGAAYDDGDGGVNRGAVHIMFMGPSGSVKSTVEINDSTTNGPTLADGDYFGRSIENIGDLDGDGINDLAVGAGNPIHSSTKGSIHIIFMNANGSVKSTVEIDDSTTNGPTLNNGDRFGYSIDNLGDLNADGVNDLAVGAPYDDNSNTDRGAIHIMFMNVDASVKSTVEINDSTVNGPTLNNGDQFGTSIDQVGDLDGNGINDLAVGAHLDDDGGLNRGAVHIIYMHSSISRTAEVSLSETLSLDDSLSKAADISISETLSFTDAATPDKEIRVVSLTETIDLVDAISKKETTIKLDETASLTDAITPEKETQIISLTETIDLVDAISKKETTIKLDETASLTDAITPDKEIRVVSLTETIDLVDAISKKETTINLDETASLTDAITPDKEIRVVSLTETIDLVDAISKKETTIKLDETASLTDAITPEKETQIISLSESISFTDNASTIVEVNVNLSESIALTDGLSSGSTTTISLSETIGLADSISKTKEIVIPLREHFK